MALAVCSPSNLKPETSQLTPYVPRVRLQGSARFVKAGILKVGPRSLRTELLRWRHAAMMPVLCARRHADDK